MQKSNGLTTLVGWRSDPLTTDKRKPKTMNMVFCRGCGKQIHETAPSCPACGALQNLPAGTAPVATMSPLWANDLNLKLYYLGIAFLGVLNILLMYLTRANQLFAFILGLCGLLVGKAYFFHKKQGFVSQTHAQNLLLVGLTAVAFVLICLGYYRTASWALVGMTTSALISLVELVKQPTEADKTSGAQ